MMSETLAKHQSVELFENLMLYQEKNYDDEHLEQAARLVKESLSYLDDDARQAAIAAMRRLAAKNDHGAAACAMANIPLPEKEDELDSLVSGVAAELLADIRDAQDGPDRDSMLNALLGQIVLMPTIAAERYRKKVLDLGVMRASALDAELERRRNGKEDKDKGDAKRKGKWEIVKTYNYRDADGKLLYQIVRFKPKNFRPRRPGLIDDVTGRVKKWIWSIEGVDRVLYRLPELLASDPWDWVFVVNGEKSADALVKLAPPVDHPQFVATTAALGAKKWHSGGKAYTEPLRGRKVAILPDNNEDGKKHAAQVVRSLSGIALEIRVVDLPGLKDGQDVTDWIEGGGSGHALLALVETADSVDDPQERYVIREGKICDIKYNKEGEMYFPPLCNFTAEITEEIALDDGEDINREFVITGRLAGGAALGAARVPASKYSSMSWVQSEWGARAVPAAGYGAKDKLREAIQILSSDIKSRHSFTHTGWRVLPDGKRVYLTASGAVGDPDVSVELAGELEHYSLPTTAENVQDAMAASLRMLDIAPDKVTVPLWCAVFLAPLSEIVYPDFVTWVMGVTGAMKSTITALALNHYGDAFDENLLPADWWGTVNSLEKFCFLCKDAMFVIDDFRPESDPWRKRELETAAGRVIRHVGNRSGRSRMNADLSLRTTYRPRGLVVSTGEQLPEGRSVLARMFVTEVDKDAVDIGKLTAAQAESHLYRHALAGYVTWLAEHWSELKRELPRRQKKLRAELFSRDQHARIPNALSKLCIGLDMGLRFAKHAGAISETEYNELLERGMVALQTCSQAQEELVHQARPSERFLTVLASLLLSHKVALEKVDMANYGIGGNIGKPDHADLLGWYDDDNAYLIQDTAYNCVAQHCAREGERFPVKRAALGKEMIEQGIITSHRKNRTTDVKWVRDTTKRTWHIDMRKLKEYAADRDFPTWMYTDD